MNSFRRRFIVASALAALPAFAMAADAARKVYRIGILANGAPSTDGESVEVFRRMLRKMGYTEGPDGNLIIEVRWADGEPARYPGLAAELVALKPDVVMARTSTAINAVKRATATIPIVMGGAADPVGSGLIRSLARPGGNITGISTALSDVSPKTVQTIHAIVPKATRIAYLMRDRPQLQARLKELQDSARAIGLSVVGVNATSSTEIERAFASMVRDKIEALIVSADGPSYFHRKLIVELAAKTRLPTIYAHHEFVQLGGLVSYGPNRSRQVELAATYVDKILKGANAGDLPVQQPAGFDLVVNLKAARALGISIPQEVLLSAEVIE